MFRIVFDVFRIFPVISMGCIDTKCNAVEFPRMNTVSRVVQRTMHGSLSSTATRVKATGFSRLEPNKSCTSVTGEVSCKQEQTQGLGPGNVRSGLNRFLGNKFPVTFRVKGRRKKA